MPPRQRSSKGAGEDQQAGASGTPAPLPDLPLSPYTNYVTASGLQQLQARLDDARERLLGLDEADELERDYLARHIRWLQARIDSAVVVATRNRDLDRVAFGANVDLLEVDGTRLRLRIVGEDEADAEHGLLSWVSPLARALDGARVGDRVRWRRADEEREVEVLGVDYDEAGARH